MRKLGDSGKCVNQGVEGPGFTTCPSNGCPKPAPGPNCSALSEQGCSGCLSESYSGRCGWCPYFKKCFDIAPAGSVFYCPPGFTTNKTTCSQGLHDQQTVV